MALIALDSVTKTYSAGETVVRALDDVSLTVERGEFLSVTGSSGSGKSTLMNMLGCLDRPSSGSYLLDGKSVFDMTDDAVCDIRNRFIGFVFQSFNLVGGLTAIENVELPLLYRGIPAAERREAALSALDRVSMSAKINHYPGQLSGGQQQRVAIARAIAASPPVILADEPTGSLDSKTGAEVMRIMTDMSLRGRTVIIITHDRTVAALAQRTIAVRDGKIVG